MTNFLTNLVSFILPFAPAPPALAKNKAGKKADSAASMPQKSGLGFFLSDPVVIDRVADEKTEAARREKLLKIVTVEAFAIAALTGLLFLASPFLQPVYIYYALSPEKKLQAMVPLDLPNMTNQAVLSWATIAVTEVLTFGFGDFESHLKGQRFRFTPDGWDSFAKAFDARKIGETFKSSHLVLTTVPSDTPVIVSQGVNEKNVYQWEVQMPVIMTYATNNNVTRRERLIIDLILVRALTADNPQGMGIQTWQMNSP